MDVILAQPASGVKPLWEEALGWEGPAGRRPGRWPAVCYASVTTARCRARTGSRSGSAEPRAARARCRSSRLSPRTAVVAVRSLYVAQCYALAGAHPASEDERQEGTEHAERQRDQVELVPAPDSAAELVRTDRNSGQAEHEQQRDGRQRADPDPTPGQVPGREPLDLFAHDLIDLDPA